MTAQDNVQPQRGRNRWLARVFWAVVCGDVPLFLAAMWGVWSNPAGQFDGLVIFVLLVFLGFTAVMSGIVALIRRPAAYVVGLIFAVPLLLLGFQILRLP